MKPRLTLVIASRNLHKIREFREMFRGMKSVELLSLLDFPHYVPPEETGTTFKENALIKARDAAKVLKQWAFADDSGLIIPRLKNSPGVYSRRYAGEEASDRDNRHKLLQEMKELTGEERSAYFECCLALCTPEGIEKCVSARCEGHILTEERGGNGFGYDSLFVKNGYDKTFAELDESVKNRISHRQKALEKLLPVVESMASSMP